MTFKKLTEENKITWLLAAHAWYQNGMHGVYCDAFPSSRNDTRPVNKDHCSPSVM